MAEENVEIRIDAEVGGNAGAQFEDVAAKAQIATDEVERLQDAMEGPFTATPAPRTTGNAANISKALTPAVTQAARTEPSQSSVIRKALTPAISQAAADPTLPFPTQPLAIRKALTPAITHAADQPDQTAVIRKALMPAVSQKVAEPATSFPSLYKPNQPLSFLEPQPTPPKSQPIVAATSLAAQAGQGGTVPAPQPQPKQQPIAAAVSLAAQAGQGGATPLPTTGLDALANKTKQVNDGAARLASTYQLLEEKQSALAKTARYKLSEQPISFVGPQPKGPPVFRLAEDRLPKPKWSTERETYPVAGETRPASPVPPRTPRVRPSTEPKPREEEGEDTEKRLGRGLRGLLAKMPTSSANAVSSVAIAAMITQAVGHGMSYVASLHDIYSNQSLSSGERTKRITETVPLVGSLAKGMHDLIDSFSGLNERVRQASYSYELFARHQAITANTRREQEPLSTRLVEMSAEATNAARFQPEYTAPQAGNQYQLQQYQRNVPITRQLYGAQAEKETAGSLVADAKRREQDAREKARVGAAQIATYKGIFDKQNAEGATEKELRPTRLGIAAGYIKQIEAAEEAKRAVSDRAKATESMAKASSSARQAEIGFKRNELADVDERESKLRGRYQTFGGMQAGTRSMALQAARQAKALGYESLGEYQKGLIKSVAPDYAKEREEEIGKKYGADEFARLIPSKNEDQRTLGELQQKQVELNQEIQIKIDLDPALLRKDIADQVGNAIRDLQIQLGKIEQIRKDEAANAKAMEAAGNT